ncbi:MAG: hypothetical protein M1831_001889 [Alyxoria varia]|nr:MAG: hypothetical protein M1831_001889 [Alyxoria varia]
MGTVPEGDKDSSPPWLNQGDNAWQMTAGSFVALQSLAGLSAIYAGLSKKKWAVNSMFMVFYGFSMTLIVWCLWAYKMGFGKQWGSFPLLGMPGPVIAMDWQLRQAAQPAAEVAEAFPMATMVYFQFGFAAITIVLIAGALLGRMNFKAWMVFVPLWITFSYTVVAFSIWGGGFLWQLGILDYAGGFVIHVSSGTAGFVAAAWVGPRHDKDKHFFPPNNVLVAMLGAAILWIGWNGFNGGGPYTASPTASTAVLNTNLCTAISFLIWMSLDYIYFKKPSLVGAIQGEITGLVAITPAAGFVAGWGAVILGVCSVQAMFELTESKGTIPWMSMNILGRQKWAQKVDDTLGVIHTHAVAGLLGAFLTGLFATEAGTTAYGSNVPGGAISGNGRVVWVQIVGGIFVIAYNIFITSLIMAFIKYVLRIPLRMSDSHLLIGDDAVHGEEAYALFFEGEHSYGEEGKTHQAPDTRSVTGGSVGMASSSRGLSGDTESSPVPAKAMNVLGKAE